MNKYFLSMSVGLATLLAGTALHAQTLQTLHVGAFVGVASAQEPKPADKSGSDSADQPVVLKVTSATIRDAQGLVFGKMEDIVVDPSSGKIEFAMVANAVNTNVISKVTPIPWRLLTARSERRGPFGSPGLNQNFQVNLDRDKLLKAPAFDHRKWPDMSKKDWAHSYLSYYGLEADTTNTKDSAANKPSQK